MLRHTASTARTTRRVLLLSRCRLSRRASTATITPASPAPVARSLVASLAEASELLGRIGSVEWQTRLQDAIIDLEPRRKRIAVYSTPLAGGEDVVSAILRDPLDDAEVSNAIMSRRGDEASSIFRLSSGPVQRSPDELSVPSPWLEKTGSDVFEVTDPLDLVRADIPIIVIDAYTLQLPSIPLPLIDRSIILINGPLPPSHTAESIIKSLGRTAIHIDSSLALSALDTTDVNQFQSLYLASGIGAARQTISTAAQLVDAEGTSSHTLHLALSTADTAVKRDVESADALLRTSRELVGAADDAVTRAEHLSTASRHLDGGLVQGGIDDSSIRAQTAIQGLFDGRLSWLMLITRLRVDDVADELIARVGLAFMDVERQLIFEAGQVSQLQSHLNRQSDDIIKRSPIRSASLINRLAALSLSNPTIDPDTLTEPIRARRAALITRTIPVIQKRAQRTLFTSYLASASGVIGAWAAHVPVELLSAPSALAVGLLSVVGSVWWGQRQWARAQRHFWADWKRSTNALRGDVSSTFKSALRTLVVAKPHAAAQGLEILANKRINTLQDTLRQIQQIQQIQ